MADDSNFPWGLVSSSYTFTLGLPVYYVVRPSMDTVYDAVKFFLTGTAMTSFHVSVFRPTAANTLTAVRTLGNVKAQLSGSVALQVIALPDPLEAVVGDVFVVGLLAVGGTAPTSQRATSVAGQDIVTGQIPEYNQITAVGATGSQTSFSSTMTLSAVYATNVSTRIWGALGTQAQPLRPPAFYVDTFNRINATDLVLPWWGRAGQPVFGTYNNTASPNTGAGMPFDYWVPSIRSDDHYIQLKLGADMDVDAGRNVDLYAGLRCGLGGTGQCVKLHISSTGSAFRIVTVTQPYDNSGLTQRATADPIPAPQLGDVVKLVADGTVYSAFYNDTPIASWIDSGAIQPVDANHRGVNIATSSVVTPNLQIIDNFEAGDFGGGVQLIGLSGVESTAAVGTPIFQANASITPAPAHLPLTTYAPTVRSGTAIQPAAAHLPLRTYAPTVSIFTPTIIEENTPHTAEPVPADAVGCWVTLRGGGGGGGAGSAVTTAATRYGGGGGGGGAMIRRFYIPRVLLGTTYSVTRGTGGIASTFTGPGGDGGNSVFASGSIVLTARGGMRGDRATGTTPPLDTRGLGGTVTATGITPTNGTEDGANGGRAGSNGGNSTYAGAGGGCGGGLSSTGTTFDGTDGGSSGGAAGTTGGASHGAFGNDSSNHALYGGGGGAGGGANNGINNTAGGVGGDYGAGGGGAGACTGSPNNVGRAGAPGYTRIEWVTA